MSIISNDKSEEASKNIPEKKRFQSVADFTRF
jgi:hypothetical protein